MANTADVRSQIQIFLQKKAPDYVVSLLFPVMPFLEFMFAMNGDKTGHKGLGRPSVDGMVVSKIPGAHARRESMMAARSYMPVIAVSAPTESDVKAMSDVDNDPTVSNWQTNTPLSRFTQPVFKFARKKMPYKIPHSDVRTAKRSGNGVEAQAAAAIRSVYDAEVKPRMASLCSVLNKQLWQVAPYSTGTPADETQTQWSQYHSINAALSATNTYAGVDRSLSANAYWRGNTISAATSYTFEDVINYCNYDLTVSSAVTGGASAGAGIQLILVGSTLFKKAKAEAKTESYQLINSGIPEYPEFGFKREIVRIYSGGRAVYVCFDPTCPAGTLVALNPDTWTVAIAPDGNFAISTPADQTQVEGGDEADTGTIACEMMLACEAPSLNAIWTNFS